MNMNDYLSDIEAILSHRYDNGGDLWTTADKRIIKGAPFSTLESVLYLLELGYDPQDELMKVQQSLFSVPGERMADLRFIRAEVSIPAIRQKH